MNQKHHSGRRKTLIRADKAIKSAVKPKTAKSAETTKAAKTSAADRTRILIYSDIGAPALRHLRNRMGLAGLCFSDITLLREFSKAKIWTVLLASKYGYAALT